MSVELGYSRELSKEESLQANANLIFFFSFLLYDTAATAFLWPVPLL